MLQRVSRSARSLLHGKISSTGRPISMLHAVDKAYASGMPIIHAALYLAIFLGFANIKLLVDSGYYATLIADGENFATC